MASANLKSMKDLTALAKVTATSFPLDPSQVIEQTHPRDRTLAAFGKRVVAQSKVCLAYGETNDNRLIARSAISLEMCEQSPNTIVQSMSRAFAQTFDTHMHH